MAADRTTAVTQLLENIREGDSSAQANLLSIVYDELRNLAAGIMHGRPGGRTLLQPTALVHEAWMKLAGNLDSIEGRRHFFSVAAKAMRHVLADYAKAQRRLKRGGDRATVALDEGAVADDRSPGRDAIDLVDLDDALTRLAALNERHARVVEMRLLGSMTIQEIANELDVSKRTIENDWTMARAWLSRELQ